MVFFPRPKSLTRKASNKVDIVSESKSEPLPSMPMNFTAGQQPLDQAAVNPLSINATPRHSMSLPRRASGAAYFSKNMKVTELPTSLARNDFKPIHSYSDSGYGSVAPSRAASERNANSDDTGSNDGSHISSNSGDVGDMRQSWSEKADDLQSGSDIASVASNARPVSVLDGYKVNTQGLVLNEEGEVIGNLIEGDIIDCVRQKINAYGEVVDEFGTVVGAVRPVEKRVASARGRRVSRSPDGASTIAAPTPLRYSQIQFEAPVLDSSVAVAKESDDLVSTSATPVSSELSEFIASTAINGSTVLSSSETPLQQETIPAITPTQYFAASREQLQRRSFRTASERSLSDLSKPFARPAMNPVPENNIADQDTIMPCNGSAFQYKGAIPLRDLPKQAYFQKTSTAAGKRPANLARHVSTGSISGTVSTRPSMPQRHSSTSSIRRGPTFSLDQTLNEYESYSPELAELDQGRQSPFVRSRPASVMTNYTTSSAKPRTYFTHAGKITVTDDEPVPAIPAGHNVDAAIKAADKKKNEADKNKKKKKTFSISSKVRQAVAAY